jgi:hypothetical protein
VSEQYPSRAEGEPSDAEQQPAPDYVEPKPAPDYAEEKPAPDYAEQKPASDYVEPQQAPVEHRDEDEDEDETSGGVPETIEARIEEVKEKARDLLHDKD